MVKGHSALIHRLGQQLEGVHPRPMVPDRRRDHQLVGAGGLDQRCQFSRDRRGGITGPTALDRTRWRSLRDPDSRGECGFRPAGRVDEAWEAVTAVDDKRSRWPEFEWENAHIDVLEALGRADDAQAMRWSYFERSLTTAHLRAYLKHLPDFDDVEAEERALAFATTYPNIHQALAFLISWPAQEKAASLVLQRIRAQADRGCAGRR